MIAPALVVVALEVLVVAPAEPAEPAEPEEPAELAVVAPVVLVIGLVSIIIVHSPIVFGVLKFTAIGLKLCTLELLSPL